MSRETRRRGGLFVAIGSARWRDGNGMMCGGVHRGVSKRRGGGTAREGFELEKRGRERVGEEREGGRERERESPCVCVFSEIIRERRDEQGEVAWPPVVTLALFFAQGSYG